jgi:hypothetical protein
LRDVCKRSIGDNSNLCTRVEKEEPLMAGPLSVGISPGRDTEISETSDR